MANREHGSKPGSGGVAGKSEVQQARKERLRELALDSIDLDKDPYFMKNHLGRFECKLCLTLHLDETSYLTHTQGKKHQSNLARRAARESARYLKRSGGILPRPASSTTAPTARQDAVIRIGRPAYKITKIKDPDSKQLGLLFQIHYPQIDRHLKPLYRFMSAFEQRQEQPADKRYQYLLFAADPYETISIKVPNHDMDNERMWSFWDQDVKIFHVQMLYRRGASLNTK